MLAMDKRSSLFGSFVSGKEKEKKFYNFFSRMGLWGSKSKLPDEEIQAISEDTGCEFFSKTFFRIIEVKIGVNSSDFDGVCAEMEPFKKCKQLFEYQLLLLLGDIW